jgi:nucleoside-diphosphate-sugar epimerase/predicted dehydrogenase
LDLTSNILIVDVSTAVIEILNQKAPDIRCKQIDFREYLKNFSGKETFDAAIIALPNCLHTEAVEISLIKGLHVLCEKPLAMNEQDCLRLARVSEEAGKVLTVGMVRRLLPSVSALREALKSGLIGTLESIDIEYGPYTWVSDSSSFFQRENGGLLMDMGVHYLDLMEELIGTLKPVSYQDDCKGGVEANLNFHLVSENGIPVNLILSRTHHLRNTAIFKGEYGELILEKNTFDFCLWRSYRANNLIARLYLKGVFKGGDWPANLISCFAEQLLEFIEAIREKKSPPVAAYQAAKTIRLIEWAYSNRQERKAQTENSPYISESRMRPTLSPAKVVVTGGTGFIGGHLVNRLVNLGFSEITVPVRNYKTCAEVARFPVRMPRINLLDYKQVKTVIQGARFVFHLAYGRDGYDAARITMEGTNNVVNAAIECRVECVVILSSMYVFGHPDTDQLVDESWPYHPTGGEYGRSKARMERWCLWQARNTGSMRIVVLNPSCVYGPGGETYTQLPIRMAHQGIFCWVQEGRGTANYTFIDNLVDAVILATSCKQAHGQRFIINDGFCSWREFLTPFLGEFANTLPSLSKEELMLKNRLRQVKIKDIISHLAGDIEFIGMINRMPIVSTIKRTVLKYNPKLHSALLDMQHQYSGPNIHKSNLSLQIPPEWLGDIFGPTKTKFSSEKARKILGWEPLIQLEEGQEKTQLWLKSIGLL